MISGSITVDYPKGRHEYLSHGSTQVTVIVTEKEVPMDVLRGMRDKFYENRARLWKTLNKGRGASYISDLYLREDGI